MMVSPTLGMADDDMCGACLFEHRSRNIARMCAGHFMVSVLSAETNGFAFKCFRCTRKKCRRHTDNCIELATKIGAQTSSNRTQFGQGFSCTIHLPVASNQRTDSRSHFILLACSKQQTRPPRKIGPAPKFATD